MSTKFKRCMAFATVIAIALAFPGASAFAATTAAPTAATPGATDTTTPTATPTAAAGTGADAITAAPAQPNVPANQYSVEVADGKIYFLKNGERTGSYSTQSSDITLSINSNGNLLVSFPNRNGTLSSVTLGDQRRVQFGGTYNSITANSSLGGNVSIITDSASSVSTMTLNAPVEAHIYGTAGTVTAQAAADVIVEKGASATRVRLVSSTSMLTANGTVKTVETNSKSLVNGSGVVQTTTLTKASTLANGSSIARSKSGLMIDGSVYNNSSSSSNSNRSSSKTTTSTSGDVRLTATTIYADYRDQLRSLHGDLEDAVRAYDRKTGKRIYGDVYWVNNDYNEVTRTGNYSYAFEADDRDYGEVRGSVRIVVDDDDYYYDNDDRYSSSRGDRNYYFEIDKLEVDIDRSERHDYDVGDFIDDGDIDDYVTAYDKSDDDEIAGDYELITKSSSTLGTSIRFRFRPDSSRYPVKTGTIKVEFTDD